MTSHEVPKALMVDGFRVRQSFGFGGLSKTATMVGAGVLVADGIIATQAPLTLLVTLPATFAVLGLAAARRHGMPALAYYWAKLSWRRAARAEATSYRRLLLPHPYALDLDHPRSRGDRGVEPATELDADGSPPLARGPDSPEIH